MPGGYNPKYVVVSLFINERSRKEKISISDVSNPVLFDIDEITKGRNLRLADGLVLSELKAHVEKYGTLEELVINGHGSTGKMNAKGGYNKIDIEYLLADIEKIEKEIGKKITNRIVFSGCNTFSKLDGNDIKFYRDYADRNNVQIVGTTSISASTLLRSDIGRYVQFTPKGEVKRDQLDTQYSLSIALEGDDRSWIDYHLGKSHEEAERAIAKDLIEGVSVLTKVQPGGDPMLSYIQRQMKDAIERLDGLAINTDVLLSDDLKKAVIIQSNGKVMGKGGVKLHEMKGPERGSSIEELQIRLHDEGVKYVNEAKKMAEVEEDTNTNIRLGREGGKVKMVLRDDKRSVLVANADGGYEVMEIGPPRTTPKSYTAKRDKEVVSFN